MTRNVTATAVVTTAINAVPQISLDLATFRMKLNHSDLVWSSDWFLSGGFDLVGSFDTCSGTICGKVRAVLGLVRTSVNSIGRMKFDFLSIFIFFVKYHDRYSKPRIKVRQDYYFNLKIYIIFHPTYILNNFSRFLEKQRVLLFRTGEKHIFVFKEIGLLEHRWKFSKTK